MPNEIEMQGMKILKQWLSDHDREYCESDDKTFDLIVDGCYSELKAKGKGWDQFDFLSLTQNQNEALGKKLSKVFLVLNANSPENSEVIEIDADDLLQCTANEIVSYEWNKGAIAHLRENCHLTNR